MSTWVVRNRTECEASDIRSLSTATFHKQPDTVVECALASKIRAISALLIRGRKRCSEVGCNNLTGRSLPRKLLTFLMLLSVKKLHFSLIWRKRVLSKSEQPPCKCLKPSQNAWWGAFCHQRLQCKCSKSYYVLQLWSDKCAVSWGEQREEIESFKEAEYKQQTSSLQLFSFLHYHKKKKLKSTSTKRIEFCREYIQNWFSKENPRMPSVYGLAAKHLSASFHIISVRYSLRMQQKEGVSFV